MKEIDLRDAFPPMGGQMERTMNRAYARIREEKRMRHKRKITLLLAAVLTLALAGTALAAGYISRLRQNLEAVGAQDAAEAVQEVGQVAEVENYGIEVAETLVEGDEAWMTVRFSTPDDEPMLLALWEDQEGVTIQEIWGFMHMVGGQYGHEDTIHLGHYDEEFNPKGIEDLDVTLHAVFLRPTREVLPASEAKLEGLFPKDLPKDQLVLQNGENFPVYVADWQTMTNKEQNSATDSQKMDGIIAGLEQTGVAKTMQRMEVTVPLRGEDEGEYVYKNVKQSEFQFDGYKVEVEKVHIGELHGEIVLRIIPDREMEIMNMDNDDPLWRSFTVYDDETGRELLYNGSGGTELDENGKVYYEKTIYPFDLGTISGRIRLVPEHTDLDCNTTVFEDEAIVLELLP